MCQCTPNIRTPWCGKPGCERPEQKKTFSEVRAESEAKAFAEIMDYCRRNEFDLSLEYKKGSDKFEVTVYDTLEENKYYFKKNSLKAIGEVLNSFGMSRYNSTQVVSPSEVE